jgi:hypothetical protein
MRTNDYTVIVLIASSTVDLGFNLDVISQFRNRGRITR